MGKGPAPYPLRKFLLATGERGLGSRVVFGDRELTLEEFELYSWIQARVLLASSEEGREEIALGVGVRKAIEIESLEEQGAITPTSTAPVDFEAMTPEQLSEWKRSQPWFDEDW